MVMAPNTWTRYHRSSHGARAAAAAALIMIAVACRVDLGMPPDARVACTSDAECPPEWSCDPFTEICVASGAGANAPPVAIIGDITPPGGLRYVNQISIPFLLRDPNGDRVSVTVDYFLGDSSADPSGIELQFRLPGDTLETDWRTAAIQRGLIVVLPILAGRTVADISSAAQVRV